MIRKANVKVKAKLKVSMANWGTGDWADRLLKSTKIDLDKSMGELTITFDFGKKFEKMALEIIKEGIEAFFNEGDGPNIDLTPTGIAIWSDYQSRKVNIPWERMFYGMDCKTEDIKAGLADWMKWQDSMESGDNAVAVASK